MTPVLNQYDFIFIDCPLPWTCSLSTGCAPAIRYWSPYSVNFFALEGLSELMNTIRNVKKMYNPYIEIEGVLLTMYDGRLNLTLQVVQEVKKYFGNKVYKTTIPRNVRLSEAPSFGAPINYYDGASKGAEAYAYLAAEFIKNNKKGGA